MYSRVKIFSLKILVILRAECPSFQSDRLTQFDAKHKKGG